MAISKTAFVEILQKHIGKPDAWQKVLEDLHRAGLAKDGEGNAEPNRYLSIKLQALRREFKNAGFEVSETDAACRFLFPKGAPAGEGRSKLDVNDFAKALGLKPAKPAK